VLDFYQNMSYYVSEVNMKLNTNKKEKEMNLKIQLNRVESIVHDDILELKREVSFDDYEDFCDDENFYNDLDHNQFICSIDELKAAIKQMNWQSEQ